MQDLKVQKIYLFFPQGNKYQMQKQILFFVQCEADPFTCQKVKKKKKRPMWIMTVTFNDLSHSKSKQTQYEMFSYQVISVMY